MFAALHAPSFEMLSEWLCTWGARIMALAAPSELLVSGAVRDLVAGSRIGFIERGDHELKGFPGTFRLYGLAR